MYPNLPVTIVTDDQLEEIIDNALNDLEVVDEDWQQQLNWCCLKCATLPEGGMSALYTLDTALWLLKGTDYDYRTEFNVQRPEGI